MFVTGQKLKKQSFEAQSLNNSGKDQFDPVLAKQGGGAKDLKNPWMILGSGFKLFFL